MKKVEAIAQGEWKRVEAGGAGVTYVAPSKMEIGEEIIGTFRETTVDKKFGGFRHRLTTAEGTTIINGTGQLDYLLGNVEPGTVIKIIYRGKTKIETGERKGTMAHQFELFVSGSPVVTPEKEVSPPTPVLSEREIIEMLTKANQRLSAQLTKGDK